MPIPIEIQNKVSQLTHHDVTIRRSAALALWNLSIDNEANRNVIRDAGGIPSLVRVLSDGDIETRRNAAGALGRLALNKTNSNVIRDAGGIPSLVRLLSDDDSDDIETQKNAAGAMLVLSYNNKTNSNAIREAGGILLLIELLSGIDLDTRRSAAGALQNLAKNNYENRVAIIDAQGISVLKEIKLDDISDARTKKLAQEIIDWCETVTKKHPIKETHNHTTTQSTTKMSHTSSSLPSIPSATGSLNPSLPTIQWHELEIKRTLGNGSFGIVSEALWQRATPVAVKQLLNQNLPEQALEDFKQEANVHLQLRHPNILTLYGLCLEPSKYALVLEFMLQGSLFDVLQMNKPLPWNDRLRKLKGAAAGVSFLHSRHILHRDLKSPNILIDAHGEAKVSDFGLSAIKESSKGSTTVAGAAGSLLWMAPELLDGEDPHSSKASDIFAFAIVLWEVASRKLPYAGKGAGAIIAQVITGKREKIPADVPKGYAHLLAKCWSQNPEERLKADEMVAALSEIEKSSPHENEEASQGYLAFSK